MKNNNYQIKTKVTIMLLLFCFAFSKSEAQDFWPGEVFFKIKADIPINLDTKSPDINIDMFDDIINKELFRSYDIESIKAPFYFTKTDVLRRTFRIKISSSDRTKFLIQALSKHPVIEYAEPIPIDRRCLSPNDLGNNSTSGQWGLHKIQATDAWNISTGDQNIIVAIVDDAIQTTHLDLAGKCIAGRDVSDNDNNTNPPYSYFPHGTHVAGIAGAATNNGTGVASIGYNVSIMPVKASPDNAQPEAACNYTCVNIYNGYSGITWAADNGADVINMSWGSGYSSSTAANVIADAWNKGAILVAAAGNSNNSSPLYPASFSNVISVAATNINDQRAYFSSYGSTVDVSAPGEGIRSTVISGGYESWDGTSMASPMVAGLCGLVLSVDPAQTQQGVVDCIINSTDNIDALNAGYAGLLGSGRINAYQAVLCASDAQCPDNLTFTTPISNNIDHQAQNWITGQTNNIIQPGANVSYSAGNKVYLKTGFHAKPNSNFHAFIDDCTTVLRTTDETGKEITQATTNQRSKTTTDEVEPEIIQGKYGVKVYPNPFDDNVKIDISGNASSGGVITLFDLNGKLVIEQSFGIGTPSLSLNTAHLHQGMYVLKIRIGEEMISRKLVK